MKTPRTVCYGLVGVCAATGYCLGAAVVIAIGRIVFHVDFSSIAMLEMSHRDIVVAVLALILGLPGLRLGQLLGASIPVRSDETAQFIDRLWHFGVLCILIWNPIANIVFGIVMGRDAVHGFGTIHHFPEAFWLGIALPLLVGLSIALLGLFIWVFITLLSGFSDQRFQRYRVGTSVKVARRVLPFVIAIAFGAYEATEFGLDPRWGIVMGLVPLLLIPAASVSMHKHELDRKAS